MKPSSVRILAASLMLAFAAGGQAQESDSGADLDAKFRSKIAKEKAKQAAIQSRNGGKNATEPGQIADCGSQNIGNVNLNGRPGSQPREVFVFAPNAINLVTARGCN